MLASYINIQRMNRRARREQYLSNRRYAKYLEERAKRQEFHKTWKAMCAKYDFDKMTVYERWDILVKEGFIDPTKFPKPI